MRTVHERGLIVTFVVSLLAIGVLLRPEIGRCGDVLDVVCLVDGDNEGDDVFA